ncbi:tyrosine-type recombinase/integrase, partial [bacterium]|nr:tyrosine-type recombinase/integrase [bacterium]
MSDWDRYLAEFQAVIIHQGNSGHKLAAARSLVKFLKLTGSAINEASLLVWTVQSARTSPVKLVVARLRLIDPFLDLLAERRDISRHAARMVRERPDLLSHLQSSGVLKSRTPVVAYWEPHLTAMVASLRGLSIGYQIQLIEAARSFAARLPAGPLETSAWQAILWEWVDELLSGYSLENVRSKFMPGLDRFLHELVQGGECQEHLLRVWRQKQSGWVDALRRRQQGAPPQLRPPRYESFLAPHLEAFLDFKKSLGRKRLSLSSLRMLDRYLVARKVPDLVSIGPIFLREFLSSRNWRATSRKKATGDLRQLFHFLERRELISPQKNPARNLPRTRCARRLPYIFYLREIANILNELLQDPTRPPFDQTLQFTFFHLLYACGLRISEPLLLKVQDVNWDEQTLFIQGTKFGKERRIPFGPRPGEQSALRDPDFAGTVGQ